MTFSPSLCSSVSRMHMGGWAAFRGDEYDEAAHSTCNPQPEPTFNLHTYIYTP